MKTKLRIASVIVGVLGVVALAVLLTLDIIKDLYLWVYYAFGVSLLMILIPLNFRVKREDEYYDALQNVRQAKKAMSTLKPDKKTGLVKLRAVKNELAETSICFREIVSEKELYDLQPYVSKLDEAITHYKDDENFQVVLTDETIRADLELLNDIEDALIKLRAGK